MRQSPSEITNFPLNKRQLLIAANIFFWITFIVFDSISTAGILDGYISFTLPRAIAHSLIFALLMVYPNLYILYPRFFSKERYLLYTLCSVFLILITFYIRTQFDTFFITDIKRAERLLNTFFPNLIYDQESVNFAVDSIRKGGFINKNKEFQFSYYLGMAAGCIGVFFITSPIKLVEDWYEKQQLKFQVLEDRLKLNETKLKFLKAQADPHFLINSLSGIYNLALLQSEKLDQAILRLSELMSYLLGYGQQDAIALKHEIQFIENFINFHQAVNIDALNISFSHNASLSQLEDISIPPMLIQPFFENALKHGNVDEPNGWLKSEITIEDEMFRFYIENSVDARRSKHKKAKSHHVGLQNVHERLDMYFPGRYKLHFAEEENTYKVSMSFQIENKDEFFEIGLKP